MSRSLCLALLLLGAGCGAADGDDLLAPQAPADESESADLPAGVFPTVEALCAEQKVQVVPRIEERAREMPPDDGRSDDEREKVEPSCAEDASALRHARASPGGRLQAFTAVTYEAGDSTRTSLVARVAGGWVAVKPALVVAYHDDPGCASILRDGGVLEVRVERGRLVVVDAADRGWGEGKGLVFRRARACAVGAGSITCDEPVTVGATLVGEEEERALFETPYEVDAHGEIAAARAWDAAELAD